MFFAVMRVIVRHAREVIKELAEENLTLEIH